MRIVEIEEREVGSDRVLTGKILLGPREESVGDLWIRRRDPGEPRPPIGDPLFALTLIPAMALHEDLRIDAPVSGDLIDAAEQHVVPTLLAWHARVRRAAVRCERAAALPQDAGARATACLFSAGVDSWYSFLRNRDATSDLVFVSGFEIPHDREDELADAVAHLTATAGRFEKRLIEISTNAQDVRFRVWGRQLVDRGEPWPEFGNEIYYGSLLVAMGLSLRPLVGRVLVPASWSFRVTSSVASHPKMEPAWSTPSLALEIDGHDATRPDKVQWLVRHAPEVLPDLRVCVDEKRRRGGQLNCGRCVKCVRLMVELRACGAPAGASPFPQPLDLSRILHKRYPGGRDLWDLTYATARAGGDDELARAIEIVSDRRFYLPRFLRDVRRAIRKRSWQEIHWPRRLPPGTKPTDPPQE